MTSCQQIVRQGTARERYGLQYVVLHDMPAWKQDGGCGKEEIYSTLEHAEVLWRRPQCEGLLLRHHVCKGLEGELPPHKAAILTL